MSSNIISSDIDVSAKKFSSADDVNNAIEIVVDKMEKMWKVLKDIVKSNSEFAGYDDKKKLSYFRDKLQYEQLMDEHPIVTRYMICLGQYSSKAFRRQLIKIKTCLSNVPVEREKGYMEDQWIMRQADYVRFLYEAYKKGKYDNLEAKMIWQNAYKSLKGEFDDFRKLYDDKKEEIEKNKQQFQQERTSELMESLRSGSKELPEEDMKNLIEKLKKIKAEKEKKENISVQQIPSDKKSLLENIPEENTETKSKPKRKNKSKDDKKIGITMIAYADDEEYSKIDDKYKQPIKNELIKDIVNKDLL